MKQLKLTLLAVAALLLVLPAQAADWYVCESTGSNRNEGTKASPFKNIQKAVNVAENGDVIRVAEGNYFGLLDCGNIKITKGVSIYGGYSADFSERDVLRHRTLIQPTATSNGSAQGQGTVQIDVRESGTLVLLDGLIMDRGNSVAYNANGEGQPAGVETPMMNPIGTAGKGAPGVPEAKVYTTETAIVYINTGAKCDVTIRNCAFLNGPNYGLFGSTFGTTVTVDNCIFVNIRIAAIELRGASSAKNSRTVLNRSTILFSWSRLKYFDDMGYGFRFMPRTDSRLTGNVIGCSVATSLDRSLVDSPAAGAASETTCENTLFFLNRLDDGTQLAGTGNREVDASVLGDRINAAYLAGFIAATAENPTGKMFANHYPVEDALKLFGANPGYGAQLPE